MLYIAVFVCFATNAVHFKIITDNGCIHYRVEEIYQTEISSMNEIKQYLKRIA